MVSGSQRKWPLFSQSSTILSIIGDEDAEDQDNQLNLKKKENSLVLSLILNIDCQNQFCMLPK